MPAQSVRQFLSAFAIYGLILLLPLVASAWFTSKSDFQLLMAGFLFSGLITALAGIALASTFEGSHMAFMAALAGSMFGKLLLAGVYVFVLVRQFPGSVAVSVSGFLLFYLLFTGFEVYHLIRNLHPHFKKDS